MNQTKIDALIKERMTNFEEEIGPIYDGIVNEAEYYDPKLKFKILWILKEPHDDGEGNWYMKHLIGDKEELKSKFPNWPRTFNPIIYVTYSILNDFLPWNGLDDTSESPEMIDILRKIAYINLKKIPGTTISDPVIIKEAYEKHKDIIKLQIETYNPDIVICGGTMRFIAMDLGIDGKLMDKNNVKYFSTNEKIYIDAYHPNQKQLNQREYCDGIINTVKDWVSNRK